MSVMRALFLTNNLPYPPASGGAIRAHGMIEGLRRAGHAVTLMCFHEGETHSLPDDLTVETVSPPAWTRSQRLRHLLLTRQPDIAGRFFDETFADHLRGLLQTNSFDLIQFEGIEMVCYLPLAKQVQPEAKQVFDTFNAEYALQKTIFQIDRQDPRRWPAAAYSWLQIDRIRRFEQQMCAGADAVVAVSPEDAALLQPICPKGRIHIVPSGVWVAHYTPSQDQVYGQSISQPEGHSLIFTGKMDYRPNVDAISWFVDSILPLIDVPDLRLFIVGQKPHPRLVHLAERDDIHLTGWVESVVPFLHSGNVYVAPLRMGSGTRLKLLEAMAAGIPIVATTIASAGLVAPVLDAMRIEDDEAHFAAAITELLHDPAQRQDRRNRAQEAVRQHYDWSVLIPRLLDVYRAIGV